MSNMVKTAIENGREVDPYDLTLAFCSGDIDTINLIAKVVPKRTYLARTIDVFDVSVGVCELSLSLGMFKHNGCYRLHNINNTAVLHWFHDHDLIEIDDMLTPVACCAASSVGQYRELLHYMIEHLHVPVPKDILRSVSASYLRDLGVYDYLIAHGADVNLDGQSLVTCCPVLLRYWLDKGCKAPTNNYETAKALVDFGNVHNLTPAKVMKIAMKALHLDVNILNNDRKTLLQVACEFLSVEHDDPFEDAEIAAKTCHDISVLLEIGDNPNVKDENGNTPLHHCCGIGNLQCATVLMEHDADVTCTDNDGQTPLHAACRCPTLSRDQSMSTQEIIELLLSHGADINVRDNSGRTALHYAIGTCAVDVLINAKADLNIADNDGRTAVHVACEFIDLYRGLSECLYVGEIRICGLYALKLLIEHGANVKVVDRNGYNALHYLCDSEDIDDGPHFRDYVRCSEFDIFNIGSHYAEAAVLLIQHGVDVNARNLKGISPLQMLNEYHYDRPALVKCLVHHGADTKGCNTGELMHLTFAMDDIDTFTLLLKLGISANSVYADGQSYLSHAIQRHSHLVCTCDFIIALIRHGADATLLDNDEGVELLALACSRDFVEPFEQLIGRFNNRKWTRYSMKEFLSLAMAKSSLKVADYLQKHGTNTQS